MPVKTTIYAPPKEGLPYLVVAFDADGMKVFPVNSEFEARTMVSERAIRRRRERRSEESVAFPAQPT
jgi:hypothetical protein